MLEGKLPEEIERLSLQSRLFFWNSCVAIGLFESL
jgi:hypothetical protein